MSNNIKEEHRNLRSRRIYFGVISSLLKPVLFSIFFLNSFSTNAHVLKLVAMTKITEHPSLEQARRGILDELRDNGFEIGKNIKVIEQNPQGNLANAVLIAKNLVDLKPNVIVAISTTSSQLVIEASKDSGIPIIFSSVTDPIAAGIVTNIDYPTEKITGSIDFPPINEEILLIESLTPYIKTIGLLYNSKEANSIRTVELIKEAIKNKWNVVEVIASNSRETIDGFVSLIGKVDAVYIPSDNTIFSATSKLVQLSRKHRLPIYSSDPDSVMHGFTACVGYSQYLVGRAAGKLLVKTLRKEKFLKIQIPEVPEIFVNELSANKIGINVPSSINGIELKLIKKIR